MHSTIDAPPAIDNPAIRLHPDNPVLGRVDRPVGVDIKRGLRNLSLVKLGNTIASRALSKGEPILKCANELSFADFMMYPNYLLHCWTNWPTAWRSGRRNAPARNCWARPE